MLTSRLKVDNDQAYLVSVERPLLGHDPLSRLRHRVPAGRDQLNNLVTGVRFATPVFVICFTSLAYGLAGVIIAVGLGLVGLGKGLEGAEKPPLRSVEIRLSRKNYRVINRTLAGWKQSGQGWGFCFLAPL